MDVSDKKALVIGGAVVAISFIAWLAFGFFGIQSKFIDDEVSQEVPTFASTEEEQLAIRATDEFQEAMVEAEENPVTAEEPEPEMTSEILTIFSGNFADNVVNGYNVVGEAQVLNDGSEQRFLRLEGFDSPNGPDLKVYLRADDGEFVSLGDLQGNIGDQNYEIPVDVDLSVFNSVDIWCERFSVGFGLATLSAT